MPSKQYFLRFLSHALLKIQIDEVRAGSIKLGLTIKPSNPIGSRAAPSEAANKLALLVQQGQLKKYELIGKADSCEVVLDAVILEKLQQTSETEFAKMKEIMEVSPSLCSRRDLHALSVPPFATPPPNSFPTTPNRTK
jgi:hypothetical protein